MFSTNKRGGDISPDGQNSATVIAHGVKVQGDFISQGDVFIEGDVQGSVKVGGMLHIGAQARLGADVRAEQAVIAGVVEGNVAVSSHLELKSSAQIVGDVSCQTVAIESGATLNGKISAGAKPSAVMAASKGEERLSVTHAKAARAST